ncbi:MAG TPA: NUDIX domain-containing protein [Candidatus Saccharimonadales bacterium]
MTRIFTEEENQKWQQKLPGKMTSACVALRSGKEVLMVKAGYKDHWTFPSGIVDVDESPKAAAIRETLEEVGLVVAPDECSLLTVVYTAASDEKDRERFNFVFTANFYKDELTLAVPNDEIEEAEWVHFDQVAEKSGLRGSYVNIQRLLLSPLPPEPYIEVHRNQPSARSKF